MQVPLKEMLENWMDTGGNSCLEQHYVAMSRLRNVAYKACFHRSHVFLPSIVAGYLQSHGTYLSYRPETRIQWLANELGLTSTSILNLDGDGLLRLLEDYPEDCFHPMISVEPSMLPYPSQSAQWGPEHFLVAARIGHNAFEVVDNYPLRHSVLSEEQLKALFKGEVRVIRIRRQEPEQSVYSEIVSKTLVEWGQVARRYTEEAWEEYVRMIEPAGQSLVDFTSLSHALMYFRLARTRSLEWLVWLRDQYGEMDPTPLIGALESQLEALGHLGNIVEISRLRKRIQMETLIRHQRRVWDIEREYGTLLESNSWASDLTKRVRIPG